MGADVWLCPHEVHRCVFTPVRGGGLTSVSGGNRSLGCRVTQPPKKHGEMTPSGWRPRLDVRVEHYITAEVVAHALQIEK